MDDHRTVLYPQAEAANQLHISVRQLQRLRTAGLVDATFCGRRVLYSDEQLLRYLRVAQELSDVKPNR